MKRTLAMMAALGGLLVLLGLGYAASVARSLDTPEFQETLLAEVRAALGAELKVQRMQISLLRGVSLKGVTIANPAGFSGDLATADAFRLRYDLFPLLLGRLQVDELALEKPVLRLAMNSKGVVNYEKLGPKSGGSASRAAPAAAGTAFPLKLVLSRLRVENAQISLVDQTGASLVNVQDADVGCAFTLAGGVARGAGEARLSSLGLADRLFVRSLSAPLEISGKMLRLGPIRGRLAEGAASGDLTAELSGGLRYTVNLAVKGAEVQKLLQEAGSAAALTGALQAKASFEGTGGLPTVKGRGRADVTDCKIRHSKLLGLLAVTLQLAELAQPDFEECRVDFTLARSRVGTPVVSLKGPAIQLTGAGSMSLDDDSIAYGMTLALGRRLLGRIPVKEVRAAFRERGDGFAAIDFQVSGTTAAPRTDLPLRIGKAGAAEAVKGAIGKLFGRKRPQP